MGGCSGSGSLSRNQANNPLPDTGGATLGHEQVGGFDYAGNGNQLPTSEEQAALAKVEQNLEPLSPNAATAFPQTVIVGMQQLQSQQAKGMDTSALRMALFGQLITACAQDVSRFVPRPGEPLLGSWIGACTSGSGNPVVASVFAKYPSTSGGVPAGSPALFVASVDSSGSPGAGSIQVGPDGTGQAIVNADGGPWKGTMTDQPQAGIGTFTSSGGSCKQVTANLVSSRNPIPAKYDEAIKRLGQCYRQALILVSPILSSYVYELTPSSAQAVIKALQLQ